MVSMAVVHDCRSCAVVHMCAPQNEYWRALVHLFLQDLGDNYDMTPLFIASDQQFTDMVNELLSLGADPNYVSLLARAQTGSYAYYL